ncbi:hypothetical protein V1520DRAFT_337454 [Lipomyces starkeyi]|uniref:F-box domain-containing protein n=1 Tax=Lipomyces starkeyi NRRL Y-11557 TaxID=675824 RepID=A0A1E3QE18_LIPST|nr:hypothetical protein LIPSTDRAFT_116318 [Lipomyces starkeyi NRRL Y-11557]
MAGIFHDLSDIMNPWAQSPPPSPAIVTAPNSAGDYDDWDVYSESLADIAVEEAPRHPGVRRSAPVIPVCPLPKTNVASPDEGLRLSNEDPVNRLPAEVFQEVLENIEYPEIIFLKRVSRSWYAFVHEYVTLAPALAFKYLDFENYELDCISAEYLLSCIKKSRGSVRTIALPTDASVDKYSSIFRSSLIFQHPSPELITYTLGAEYSGTAAITSVWGPDPQSLIRQAGPYLRNLRKVHIDDGFSASLYDWKNFGDDTASVFFRLEEFHISMRTLPRFFEFLGSLPLRLWFPNLQILECNFDKLAKTMDNQQVWPDMSSVCFSTNFVALPALRIFKLGGVPDDITRLCPMDQQCLDLAIRWMPNLEIFSCRGICVMGRGSYGYIIRRSDFRWNKKLLEFDFSYSNTTRMPAIMSTCKKLTLRNAGVFPRTLYYIFGQPVGYLADPVDMRSSIIQEDLRHVPDDMYDGDGIALISDEYGSLEELDLSGSQAGLTNGRLMDTLARCNGNKLRKISLQGCTALHYDRCILGEVKIMQPNLMYQIISILPHLTVLKLGNNETFSDGGLRAIEHLHELEYLDIAQAPVSEFGMTRFIKLVKTTNPKLETVVLTGCSCISEQTVRMVEDLGIRTTGEAESRLF